MNLYGFLTESFFPVVPLFLQKETCQLFLIFENRQKETFCHSWFWLSSIIMFNQTICSFWILGSFCLKNVFQYSCLDFVQKEIILNFPVFETKPNKLFSSWCRISLSRNFEFDINKMLSLRTCPFVSEKLFFSVQVSCHVLSVSDVAKSNVRLSLSGTLFRFNYREQQWSQEGVIFVVFVIQGDFRQNVWLFFYGQNIADFLQLTHTNAILFYCVLLHIPDIDSARKPRRAFTVALFQQSKTVFF